jgi:hypothetical protein
MYICVKLSLLSLSTIFRLEIGIVPTEIIRSCKCLFYHMWVNCQPSHLTRRTTLLYDDLLLNIIHDFFKRRDTEVVICIILVPLKRANRILKIPKGSPPVFTWSLVLCICFVDRCLSICTFSFSHCVVCSSSTNEFWLPPFGIRYGIGTRSSIKTGEIRLALWDKPLLLMK